MIELMITLVIVGVLAAVAYPSFIDAVRKSRRSDAVAALSRVQHAQERWRANNKSYSTDLGETGLKVSNRSPDGLYDVAVSSSNERSYTVTATARSGTSQAGDVLCKVLQIRMVDGGGVNAGLTEYGSSDGSTLNTASNNPCWVK